MAHHLQKPLRVLLTFGTRPEAIKLAPLLHACQRRPAEVEVLTCITGQHREMLTQVTDYFGIHADIDLQLMRPNQSLAELTARCITAIDQTLAEQTPDCIVVQGDTTTVMAAGVAAFYRQVPVVHVEAGLRTGNLQSPWPEEFNRRVATLVSALHCAPTQRAADQLLAEHVDPRLVHVTGNTVIDALQWTLAREREQGEVWNARHEYLAARRMVLITGHRRESFGDGFERICTAIAQLAGRFPEVVFLYPVHLNPRVREPVQRHLGHLENVKLLPPASYPEFVWLMDRCTLILTDSGGVQEESMTLKKPTLVMRDNTERPEALALGASELVGTDAARIVASVSRLLNDPAAYAARQVANNPYGDGHAAERILDLILARAWQVS